MIVLKILLALILIFLVCVLFTWIVGLPVDGKKEYNEDSRFYRGLLNIWTKVVVFVMRIHITAVGMEQVPEGRFLLVQNHRSNFDPILTWYVFRKTNLSFVSKEENMHIPFFGKIIRRCCFRSIDRENPRNALKTIIDVANLIKNDVASFGIYPEGTRNKNLESEKLLPFHNGVFKIAQMAKVPIVVTTIDKTELIAKNFPLRSSKIKLEVVEVIYPDEIDKVKTDIIGDRVRADMLK